MDKACLLLYENPPVCEISIFWNDYKVPQPSLETFLNFGTLKTHETSDRYPVDGAHLLKLVSFYSLLPFNFKFSGFQNVLINHSIWHLKYM